MLIKTEIDDQLQDCEEQGPGPAGGAAEPEEPTKPIGKKILNYTLFL